MKRRRGRGGGIVRFDPSSVSKEKMEIAKTKSMITKSRKAGKAKKKKVAKVMKFCLEKGKENTRIISG